MLNRRAVAATLLASSTVLQSPLTTTPFPISPFNVSSFNISSLPISSSPISSSPISSSPISSSAISSSAPFRLPVTTLRSVSSLPAHIAGAFQDFAACHLTPDGDFLVFDRRAHSVYRVRPDGSTAPQKVVQIGVKPGEILQPMAFASAPDGTFLVADSPGVDRIQIFLSLGAQVGGFTLPARSIPRVVLGDVVLSGVGSIDYTGKTILVSQPDASRALITEYDVDGKVLRSFGELRKTGHEADADLHLALNGGLPLAIPGGGYYYVFVSGVPMFRKYDAKGLLLFERHIEGPEVDEHLRKLPGTWPRRKVGGGEYPIVPSGVRTAAVDASGDLWISLLAPKTYVYDPSGDKTRVVEFRGAGVFAPNDLFFTHDGRIVASPGCYVFAGK